MERVFHSKLGEGRRITIPAEACAQAKIAQGDAVVIVVRRDGLHVRPFSEVLQEVQQAFAPYRKPGVSVVDDLLRERREEAAREGHD